MKERETQDHRARSCEGVQQNTSPSSAETQDPPCQDPGDRTEEPSGIRHLRNEGGHAMNYYLDYDHIGRHPTVWGSWPKLRRETSD